MRILISVVLVIAAAGLVHAADEPLRVYAYGAAGASVYVAPVSAIAATDAGSAEIGRRAFGVRYLRGKAPLELQLKPGQYLVSVVLATEQNMRDASLKAGEFVWDGYDHHALVGQKRNTWRYAQSYLIDKQEGWATEVLAVFTDQMPLDEALSFDCGSRATRYTSSEDDAAEALTAQRIPMTFHADIIKGLQAGHKVLLRSGDRRFAVQCDGTVSLRVTTAHGQGAWAGHRLSIVSYE